MSFANAIERLDDRQAVYEERVSEFSGSIDRRNALFDRAQSLSQICDDAEQDHIILDRTESGNVTTAVIRAELRDATDMDDAIDKKIDLGTSSRAGLVIRVLNAAGAERVELPWEHTLKDRAMYHAHKGRKFTPFGVVTRALSLRLTERGLDRFSDAMDLLESVATDPELNPGLAGLIVQNQTS